jgi:microcystin-dependent protein
MASTLTPNYGWTQPNIGGDAQVWGADLNNDLALIDAQVYANEQATVMVGCITMYGGATAPANWLLCQGQSLATTGTYAALFGVIGYAFGGSGANFNLPNLQGRFPYGGAPGPAGGAFAVTLAAANMPAHTHTISDPGHTHGASQPAHNHGDPGHVHGVNDPTHAHTVANIALGSGTNLQPGAGFNQTVTVGTSANPTGISIQAAGTGIQAAQPGVTVNAALTNIPGATGSAGSGAAFNVIPPYQTVQYIIRYQ